MATEVTETVDKEVKLLPCPFCGSQPEAIKGWQVSRVSCRNRSCGLFGTSILTRFWNVRIDAPTTRQRAERAARRIVKYALDSSHVGYLNKTDQLAAIIAAEFEK